MIVYAFLLLGTLVHVCSANPRQQCRAPTFSCWYNNPCHPLCVPGQYQYHGESIFEYVECVEGGCIDQHCPRPTIWHRPRLMCVGEDGRGVRIARCAFGESDCEARNPCTPTLCEAGVQNYPGPSPRRYVTCAGGCTRALCPPRHGWDQEKQRCVGKNTCRWEEIAVSTPAVDCSNDFSFPHRYYNNEERGFLHYDGFVDCDAASGGYYVEDHSSNNKRDLASCHPSTGLCFNLTSEDNGGTDYTVYTNNGPSPFDYPINEPLSDLDHEVPESCVEMSTVARLVDYPSIGAFSAACYQMGVHHIYMRKSTYRGSCSNQIPCHTISSTNVTMYQIVCE